MNSDIGAIGAMYPRIHAALTAYAAPRLREDDRTTAVALATHVMRRAQRHGDPDALASIRVAHRAWQAAR